MTSRSRGSRAWRAASWRSVHHGLTRTRSPRDGRGAPAGRSSGGHGGGPVSTGSDARHMPAQVPRKRTQSAPAPGDHASSAATVGGRSAEMSTCVPSANA
jgi:hypothetical protein